MSTYIQLTNDKPERRYFRASNV